MNKRKQAITLLEIMIVIFLIGLIGSVIGYNMKGSLDEGRKFKTEEGMARIKEILELEIAQGATAQEVAEAPAKYLTHSGLVSNADKLLKDGWNQPYQISAAGTQAIRISSEKLTEYLRKKNKTLGKSEEEHEEQE